jgi:ketosteroid isomerase-like protein
VSNTNRELLHRFYSAFAQRDAETMATCYQPDATFKDPVFELRGAECGDMWRMLCTRGKDLRLEFSDIAADALTGSARWTAWYTFSATGRQVENRIAAAFRFKDGLIAEHVDTFSFWRWSRQALGLPGLLLGWTGAVQRKVLAQARANLDKFRAERAAAGI